MVSYREHHVAGFEVDIVLILVVVDDGLVLSLHLLLFLMHAVLILVVVDDGLVPNELTLVAQGCRVLILVVVDDGLVLCYTKLSTGLFQRS